MMLYLPTTLRARIWPLNLNQIIVDTSSMNRSRASGLEALPDEVLHQILNYLEPKDIVLSIQRLSTRFGDICVSPLLWRYYCRVEFLYWDSKHCVRQKLLSPATDTDWKNLYMYRQRVDALTTYNLDAIIRSQTNRIEKFTAISSFGYDAKETLLRHCQTEETAGDVLARRYYARAVLDHLHRSRALAEWRAVANCEPVPVERALGAFDLFILHDKHGDLEEISHLFDDLARLFRTQWPDIDQLSTREKALAAVSFLRANNMTGLKTELAYRDLQNNYIGIALQDQDHPSLPLISVAIFCALGKRIGLDARSCGMPNHVHAMVYARANETLDGRRLDGDLILDNVMYLDPFRTDVEIPISNLRSLLASWAVQPVHFDRFLAESSIRSLVLRTSRNILATVRDFRGLGGHAGRPTIRPEANPYADMDDAFYSALWANFLLSSTVAVSDETGQRQFVPLILERFERLYPMDASLVEKYLSPLLDNNLNPEHRELQEALRVVRVADQEPKRIKVRSVSKTNERVRYRVGQVFRHRRYAYTGIITGWDVECGMSSDWIAHNNVDKLSLGRNQSFYHALVEDSSIRYVAEENIEVIEQEIPTSLVSSAGRYFKCWDTKRHLFVSNLRDEYPDD